MANVVILGIHKTCLDYDPYLRLAKKYTSSLKNDVVISFDLRLKTIYGYHSYNFETKTHKIQIGPKTCGSKNDKEVQIYSYIATTIHELKHAMQQEKLGAAFESKKYSKNKDIKDNSMSEFYSVLEIEARIFEEQNLSAAVKFYNTPR